MYVFLQWNGYIEETCFKRISKIVGKYIEKGLTYGTISALCLLIEPARKLLK